MVRCADCGFLGKRDRQTRELRDAEEASRRDDWEPTRLGGSPYQPEGVYEYVPLCTQRRIEFKWDEVPEAIKAERECSDFMSWCPGFTPKEHQEMRDHQYLMNREDRRDGLAEVRYQEQMKEQRAEHKRELLILGGLMIAAVLTAAVINAGWIPKPSWAGNTANQPAIVVVTAIPERVPISTPIPLSTPSTAGFQPQ